MALISRKHLGYMIMDAKELISKVIAVGNKNTLYKSAFIWGVKISARLRDYAGKAFVLPLKNSYDLFRRSLYSILKKYAGFRVTIEETASTLQVYCFTNDYSRLIV